MLGVLAGPVGADRALCGCNLWTALQPPVLPREPRRARALPGLSVAERSLAPFWGLGARARGAECL